MVVLEEEVEGRDWEAALEGCVLAEEAWRLCRRGSADDLRYACLVEAAQDWEIACEKDWMRALRSRNVFISSMRR